MNTTKETKGVLNMTNLEIFVANLGEAIDSEQGLEFFGEYTDVRTYKEAGLMTVNDGLVVHLQNGREYQITVVQSK